MVKLLRKCDCAYLRDQYKKGQPLYTHEGIGQPKIMRATGRSTCRLCGKKIQKNDLCIQFAYDDEGNSWTAIDMYIHLNECLID